jgi:hypothetical protein
MSDQRSPYSTKLICLLGHEADMFPSAGIKKALDYQGHDTLQHSWTSSSPGQHETFSWPWPPVSPYTARAQERRYVLLRSIYKMQHVMEPATGSIDGSVGACCYHVYILAAKIILCLSIRFTAEHIPKRNIHSTKQYELHVAAFSNTSNRPM